MLTACRVIEVKACWLGGGGGGGRTRVLHALAIRPRVQRGRSLFRAGGVDGLDIEAAVARSPGTHIQSVLCTCYFLLAFSGMLARSS